VFLFQNLSTIHHTKERTRHGEQYTKWKLLNALKPVWPPHFAYQHSKSKRQRSYYNLTCESSRRLSLTSPLDGGGYITPLLGRCTPGNDPEFIEQEAGWAPGPVWTGAGFGIRFLDHTARKKSPLCYPGLPTNLCSGEALQ